jgi:uncharacterized membrane protein YqgA involved in biofilm formation
MDDFWKVNAAQVATILVVIGGIVGVWFKMRFQLENLSEKIKMQESVIREFESKGVILVLGQHEARLVKLEALQLTLGVMQTDIALIKQALSNSWRDKQLES